VRQGERSDLQDCGVQAVEHAVLRLPAVEAHPAAQRYTQHSAASCLALHVAAEAAQVRVQPLHVAFVNFKFFRVGGLVAAAQL
jgi:hypothetical protein